jgi:hypothetical protein
MKKTILITTLILLALGVLGVSVAFAQGSQPLLPGGYGPMHEYVEQAVAAKLSLTEEQVEDQLASGKTMVQIALNNDIKQEDLGNFMSEVHKDAFASAVKDSVMTQGQADWMLQQMQNRGGYGIGNCPMHNRQGAPFGRGSGVGPSMMGRWGQGIQNP